MLTLQKDHLIIYCLIFAVLVLLINVYFKVAERFKIVDIPNHRSSHDSWTIRGGGLIFPVAILIYPLFFNFHYPYFLIALLLISLVSFIDDVKPISSVLRFSVHLFAAGLLFHELGVFALPFYILLGFLFVTIGTINAINFMDGINGMTGGYAFITLLSLLYINEVEAVHFTSTGLIVTALLSIIAFSIYNFRKKARCFAGDVGSVSIAFILLFFIGQLLLQTGNFSFILLLLVYGLDTVTTILFRILRREHVSQAHRSHYYQFLVNERKMPHLYVSTGYALVQLAINIMLITYIEESKIAVFVLLLITTGVFISLRFGMEGKARLFKAREA